MSEFSGGGGTSPGTGGAQAGESNPPNTNTNRRNNRNNNRHQRSKFEGGIVELKDFVYDVSSHNEAENFQRTTRAIGEYIARKLDDAGEFRNAFDPNNLGFDTITFPAEPQDVNNPIQLKRWEMAERLAQRRTERREALVKQAYAIVLGQCSQSVRDRIEAAGTWKTINDSSDVIALLKLIRRSLFTGAAARHPVQSLQDAEDKFMSFRQGTNMTVATYLERFRELYEIYEHLGGRIDPQDAVIRSYLPAANQADVNVDLALWTAALSAARDQYLAIRFIRSADRRRYGSLMAEVVNSHTRGQDTYPTTLTRAFNMLVDYVDPTPRGLHAHGFAQAGTTGGRGSGGGRGGRGGAGRGGNTGRGGSTTGQTDNNRSAPANATTDSNNTSNDNAVNPYLLAHLLLNERGAIPETWILADSCSSTNIIRSKSLLHDIFDSTDPLILHCNAGTVTVTQKGYFGDYPEPVWFYPEGIANIMSLENITRHYRVTMDSDQSAGFMLHKPNGRVYAFTPSGNGLFRYEVPSLPQALNMWTLVTTVSGNMKHYTKREIAAAKAARTMQDIIMHEGDQKMKSVAIRYLQSPVQTADVDRATDIYGPNLGSLKGKTPHRATPHVPYGVNPVPADILSRHREVTLSMDILFVNGLPFLLTCSRGLKFISQVPLPDRQTPTVANFLRDIIATYAHRGFTVTSIDADPEFQPLEHHFPKNFFNFCAQGAHVPDIERCIRTVKDRVRSRYSRLPFKRLPRAIVRHLVENAVLWLNALPANDGISKDHSPYYIMYGWDLTYKAHVRTVFGAYVQTHEDHSNNMQDRTLGAICLGPTGNKQGTHYFMSLATGLVIRRQHWTELPMTDLAIRRVTLLGRKQKMPAALSFANRLGEELFDTFADIPVDDFPEDIDDDDDSSYHSSDLDEDDDADDDDFDQYIDDDVPVDLPHAAIPDVPPHLPVHNDMVPDVPDDDSSDDVSSAPSGRQTPPPRAAGNAVTPRHHSSSSSPNESSSSSGSTGVGYSADDEEPSDEELLSNYFDHEPIDDDADDAYLDRLDAAGGYEPPESPGVSSRIESPGVQSPVESPGVTNNPVENTGVEEPKTEYERFKLAEAAGRASALEDETTQRPKRSTSKKQEPDYSYLTALLDTFDPRHHNSLFSLVTAQLTANKGVKVFGTAGEEAIAKELRQLMIRKVMHGVPVNSLTPQQKQAALRYLMFLKEKRSGLIKGRGCADGRKQRIYKTKEETSSPTVTTESIFISSLIDAVERRYTVTCDVPGAFMQADIDEVLHLKIDGAILEVLLRTDPTYQQFITFEKGKKVLYTQLDKALYGTLQAALLFWRKLSKYLIDEMGFEVNPYDFCVVNKMINGKQCTIIWYVDDLKISHESKSVVEEVLQKINDEFGKEAPLTATHGKVHEYLGMNIDYSEEGQVKFKMLHHIDELIKQIPKDLRKGVSSSPAGNHLFTVNTKAEKLSEEDSVIFHHLTAQLLFCSMRARPDLQTAVSFLTTRVQSPDVDDWKKLGRTLRWVRRTRNLPLVLEADNLHNIIWWIDASYGVHPDLKSHTGATVTFGKGSICSMSTRQKLNTRSSTEAELVGVNDAMSKVLWIRHFLEAQGYTIESNVIHQDNESAMLLEKNGRRSSTKRTRHIEIRYFFITDNIERKKVTVKYCPTGEMVADYFTKPLQGSTFRKFLKIIMNVSDEVLDSILEDPSPQECVGDMAVESNESNPDQEGRDPTVEFERTIDTHDNGWMAKNLSQPHRTWAEVVRSNNKGGK